MFTDPLGTQPPVPLAPWTTRVPTLNPVDLALFDAALVLYDIYLIEQLGEAYGWWGPAAARAAVPSTSSGGPPPGAPGLDKQKELEKCPKGKWTCLASAQSIPILGEAPPGAQAYCVYGYGSGNTRSEAARAALDRVQGYSPRGYDTRHAKVKVKVKDCWPR
jgi:hypothetical protein